MLKCGAGEEDCTANGKVTHASGKCKACSKGKYAPAPEQKGGTCTWQSECKQCEPGKLNWRVQQAGCAPCPPQGVDCKIQDSVVILKGFYRPINNDSSPDPYPPEPEIFRCPLPSGCKGGSVSGSPSCANGYFGPLCGRCGKRKMCGQQPCADGVMDHQPSVANCLVESTHLNQTFNQTFNASFEALCNGTLSNAHVSETWVQTYRTSDSCVTCPETGWTRLIFTVVILTLLLYEFFMSSIRATKHSLVRMVAHKICTLLQRAACRVLFCRSCSSVKEGQQQERPQQQQQQLHSQEAATDPMMASSASGGACSFCRHIRDSLLLQASLFFRMSRGQMDFAMSLVRIMVTYVQSVAMFNRMEEVQWPPFFRSFVSALMRLVDLDVSVMPWDCVGISFEEQILWGILTPIILSFVLWLIAILAWFSSPASRSSENTSRTPSPQSRSWVVWEHARKEATKFFTHYSGGMRGALIVTHYWLGVFFLPNVIRTCLALFEVVKYQDDTLLLRSYPDHEFAWGQPRWNGLLALSTIGIIIWILFLPALPFIMASRDSLCFMRSPRPPPEERWWKVLHSAYTEKLWWFEYVAMWNK